MGLANVDFNTSDAGGTLSGSYPLLNKNNILSILVISADGSSLQVNLQPTLQISFFSKCYLVLHMYADHIYLKLLGITTSLSCRMRHTGTSLRRISFQAVIESFSGRSNTT